MKTRTTLLALTALVLVAGCSRGGTANKAATGNTATNAAAPANTAAPANAGNTAADAGDAGEGGGVVDIAFLTGRWGMNGDCSHTMEFRADGTTSPPEGSTYTVEGNVVTVTDPGRPPDPRTVTRTGDDSMTVSGGSGPSMNMTRCR
jgi:hypothetical protein